jgi:transposase
MDAREQRGLVIAALCKLNRTGDKWLVPSQTGRDTIYHVNPAAQTCTCPDHSEAGHKCKHLYAVEIVMKREVGSDGTVTETKSITFTEKKVYKQNWTAYNLAQTTEKHRFQVLLRDLCRGLMDPPLRRGQSPVRAADAIFAATFKVYSTVSARRFMCDLADAHERGYVSKPMHFNSVLRQLDNPAYTEVLARLIVQASLPLRAVEVDFACDSSGFTTSRFVKWFDHKYGITRTGHDWVKAHVMVGVKTNIVTAVEIKDRNAADSPIMPGLVSETAKNFAMREVSADKGYSSVENIETIAAAGATPFIAFKSNTTGHAGGLWEKMFHFYSFNREQFFAHYHKRSNVESTFSMIKAKFGDHVRSKSDTAMRNEVLAKILAHNICVLIQSQCELGIETTFWPTAPQNECCTSIATTV